MKLRTRLAAVLGAGILVLAVAGTAAASLKYATPWGHYASTAGDHSNDTAFWEDYLDLSAGSCTKTDGADLTLNDDGSVSLGAAYDWVIVKQANPNAKDVTYDNTIFHNVAADETVYADTNGDNDYDTDDSNGISHVIVCGPAVTTTTETFTESTGGETTTIPQTSEFGTTSNTTDQSWMLIAALGMVLGSALVLAPARAKSRR